MKYLTQCACLFLMFACLRLIASPVYDLASDKPLWIINSDTDSYQTMVAEGIIDPTYERWLVSGIQVVLMGDIIDPNTETAPQLAQLSKLQRLASQNNSQLLLLRGINEQTLIADNESFELDSPMLIRWNKQLLANKGLSLTAQLDEFNNWDESFKWNNNIHLPMYYVGSQICHPYVESARLRTALANLQVDALWVSRDDAVEDIKWSQRLNNQVNILGANVVVKINPGEQPSVSSNSEQLSAEQGAARYPQNPLAKTDQEIIEMLTEGKVVGSESIPTGVTKPLRLTLEYQGETFDAIFKSVDNMPRQHKGRWAKTSKVADRYGFEVAAFKLDRLLGLGLVPAVIERTIDGQQGALQIWYDGLINKLSYRQQEIAYGGHCDRKAQREMMHVFDYLIHNSDRNQSNILYNQSDWQIWFIDHSRAFDIAARRHDTQRKSKFSVTEEFRIALESVSRDELKQLRDWLHRKQVAAIDQRRRKLIRDDF